MLITCKSVFSSAKSVFLGLFSRRAILGRSNKSTVVLEKIAKENSLNRTGSVNFNTYGKQDGIGFASLLRREMLDRYGLQKCKVKAGRLITS